MLLIASVAGFEARRSFLQATYTEFLPNALLKIFLFFLICIVLSKEVMNGIDEMNIGILYNNNCESRIGCV